MGISSRFAFLVLLVGQFIVLGTFLFDHFGLLSGFVTIAYIGCVCLVYSALGTLTSRLITAFAIFLGATRDSVPVTKIAMVKFLGLTNAFMYTDRLNVGLITASVFLFAMMVDLLMIVVARKNVGALAAFGFCLFFLVTKFIIDLQVSERLSTYQFVVDSTIILACVLLYFGVSQRDLDLKILRREIWPLAFALALIAIVDAAGSALNVASWVRSPRDAYQGILSGSEVYFAVRVCIAAIILRFLFDRKYLLPTKLLLFIPGIAFLAIAAILSDNLTSSIVLALVLLITLAQPRIRLGTAVSLWSTFVVGAFLFLWFFGQSSGAFDVQSSLLARVGTVVAPLSSWSQQPVFGIGSGLFDVSQVTNLGASIFDRGYADYLSNLGLGDSITQEMVLRSGADYAYGNGGEFTPHFAPAFILYAYGLPTLPFVFMYLFYFLPYFVCRIGRSSTQEEKLFAAIGAFLVIFSFVHPVVPLFEVLFAYSISRALSSVSIRRTVPSRGQNLSMIGPRAPTMAQAGRKGLTLKQPKTPRQTGAVLGISPPN